jgi:5'(3')-deoxyribonucleotidase
MKNKIRIGIDIDGVLRDFGKSFMKVMKKHYPETMLQDKITDWQFEKHFTLSKKELQEIYWDTYCDAVFLDAPPIYGAIQQMQNLFEWASEKDYTLVCISSQRPMGRHNSLHWIGKHGLGFEEVHFVMGRYKWKKDVDWLVDDSPENWHNWKRGRGNDKGFILMDAVYNQHIEATNRIKELKEVKDIIQRSYTNANL